MIEKKAYEEIVKSNLQLLPAGICSIDSWKLLYANSALCRFFNFIYDKVSENTLIQWFTKGVLNEIPSESENRGVLFLTDDAGGSHIIRWHICEDIEGEKVRFFSISEMPREESQRRQEAREISSILDFIHDGIWVIDGNGITLRINKAMERIAGIRSEEVVGKHVSEPIREGRFKTSVTLRALQARHTVTLFDDYSNGKRCLNTSTPVFDSEGKVWRVIAAIRDITELDALQTRLSNLEVEAMAYRLRVEGLENQNGLYGQSPLLRRVLQDINKAAQSDAVILITGETGTGKSVAAKKIHELSKRSAKPFVVVNCGAIPESLIESELFGYEKGAFTGASKNGKPGMIELAAGGTLFLDEIGELSLPVQAKLLHVLDGESLYRVGGTKSLKIDAHVIAATNQPLEKMVEEGRFREDLFYRLRVLCVNMPPLRERKDDILLLAWHFLQKSEKQTGKKKILDPHVEQLFLAYSWPGNVRELQSVLQSLVILCEHDQITAEDLPSYMKKSSSLYQDTIKTKINIMQTLPEAIERLEQQMLAEALAETGSTYKAARKLGISQSSVARKAKKYNLRRFVMENEDKNA